MPFSLDIVQLIIIERRIKLNKNKKSSTAMRLICMAVFC